MGEAGNATVEPEARTAGARESRDIKKADLKAALEMLKRGKQGEIGDSRIPGLSIRIRAKSVSWSLRGRLRVSPGNERLSTWKIEDVSASDDIEEIRRRATHARSMLREGRDPQRWLLEQAGRPVPAEPEPAPARAGGWTWPEARSAFLKHVQDKKAPKTFIDYRNALNGPWLATRWDDRMLAEISRRDIMSMQNDLVAAGHGPQAHHLLRVVSSLMSWCCTQGASGLERSVAADVAPEDIGKPKMQHVPSAAELEGMAWRLQSMSVLPQVRLGVMLLALSAVRRESLMTAKREHFETVQMDGCAIWSVGHVKGADDGRPLVLPLGPLAWSVVQALIGMSGASPWLFPQTRTRRAGGKADGHMSGNLIADAVAASLPGATPHDLRRALATRGPQSGTITDIEVADLLGHAIPGVPVVTRKHYALHDGSHARWRPALAWERYIVAQIKKGAPDGVAPWPAFLPFPDCYR